MGRTVTADPTPRLGPPGVVANLVVVLVITYFVWEANGTFDDEAGRGGWVLAVLVAAHVGAGVLIGRFWAVALPLAWAAIALPATGDGETPPSLVLLFQAPFFWCPAILLGVLVRKAPRWWRARPS
jgi:hypothetical protein